MKKRPIILKIIIGEYDEDEEDYCSECGSGNSECECDSEEDDEEEEGMCPDCGRSYDECKCDY